jgi:isopenicillin N synthase-like dioxygenase
MLTTFGFPGLQVQYRGKWRTVKPVKDTMVVNLGDMLSRATNFKLKSTKHRVLDIGIERYSQPFFLEPKFSTIIPSNLISPKESEKADPVTFGEWWVNKMTSTYAEWRNFKMPKIN